MSRKQSKKLVFSDRSVLSSQIIELAKQLKASLNAKLHKRRIKSVAREIIEIVNQLFLDNDLTSDLEKTKDKIRVSKREDDFVTFFSSEWIVNSFLRTIAVKKFLAKIKDFQDFRIVITFTIIFSKKINEKFIIVEKQSQCIESSFFTENTSERNYQDFELESRIEEIDEEKNISDN